MNINQDFTNEFECPEAQEVMDQSMDFIFDKLINPMNEMGKLTEEDLAMISLIGISLKIISEQASLYEKSVSEDTSQNFYKN